MSYRPVVPSNVEIHPQVESFFASFFRISDTPGLTDEYVRMFTKDATFVMASKSSRGTEGSVSLQPVEGYNN